MGRKIEWRNTQGNLRARGHFSGSKLHMDPDGPLQKVGPGGVVVASPDEIPDQVKDVVIPLEDPRPPSPVSEEEQPQFPASQQANQEPETDEIPAPGSGSQDQGQGDAGQESGGSPYRTHHRGFGWYDVLDADDQPVNTEAIKGKEEARKFIAGLQGEV